MKTVLLLVELGIGEDNEKLQRLCEFRVKDHEDLIFLVNNIEDEEIRSSHAVLGKKFAGEEGYAWEVRVLQIVDQASLGL